MANYAVVNEHLPASECVSFASQKWNGWVIPEFTLTQAVNDVFKMLMVGEYYNQFGYNAQTDTVWIVEPDRDPSEARIEYQGYLNKDGTRVYAIGGGMWTWDKHECCDHVEYESYCRCCGAESAHV
jgi:hypothetical protein